MNETESRVSVGQLLRIAASLWLVYLLVLALIDMSLAPRNVPFEYRYYLMNGLTALIILGLALWSRGQEWLGRSFLPLIIILMSVLPIVSKYVLTSEFRIGPPISMGGLTVLLMALVLTAWQYRWSHVTIFALGVAALNLGITFSLFTPRVIAILNSSEAAELNFRMKFMLVGPQTRPFFFEILATMLQTVSFLVIGYFINALVGQLRAQQGSLEQANTQLVHYASTLEHLTISRERNRMARELHDTLAHTLSGLSVQLETVKAYWSVDSSAAQAMLDKSLEATRSGLQETRRALKSLRASPLDDLGLSLALQRMAESAAHRANLSLDLAIAKELPSLSPDVEQTIYRVAQEAVANASYHANARNLLVHLDFDGQDITLLVRDDGLGFEVGSDGNPDHFGLPGMRERAQLVGGQLLIDSQPGQGTAVRLTVRNVE